MLDSKQKLTIGIIQQTPGVGGAETYMFSLINEFLKNENKILFATNNSQFSEMVSVLPVVNYRIPVLLDVIGNIRGLIKAIFYLPYAVIFYIGLLHIYKKQNVNVILMSGFSEKMLVSFLSLFFHIPVVWIEYGRLKLIFKRNFYLPKLLYICLQSIPKTIIVPTHFMSSALQNDAKISDTHITVIPCGIDIKGWSAKKIHVNRPEWKNKIIIGNVSRLMREKGQDILIKSIPYVLKKHKNIMCVIIGEGYDEEYLKRLVQSLKLTQYVEVNGYIDDLKSYYSAMDLFVFPTRWELEGFGIVMLEAMIMKVPIIATKFGPVPEIIDNNRTGILVPAGDEKKLAEAIIELIENQQKRKHLAEHAYHKVVSSYDIQEISKKILSILFDASGK